MTNDIKNTILIVLVGIWALAVIMIIIKGLKDRFSPVKIAKATVIHKQINESFSQYAGDGKRRQYVIVFSVEGKKKAFYVSEFSYNGYRINEKGTLKYQGDRLIDFH